MDKIIVLSLILFGLFRFFLSKKQNRPSKYLLISCFVQTIPMGFSPTIYQFLQKEMLGAFTNAIRIEMSTIFIFIFLSLGYQKFSTANFSIRKNNWFYIILLLGFISIVNPVNPFVSSVLVPLLFIVQLFLFLKIVEANFTKLDILKGIFDGLVVVSCVQIILSICYPILGIKAVTTIFKEDVASRWADRREGYPSAVGTFGHPGELALFCLMTCVFFCSCYFNKYKKRIALIMVLINLFVIVVTFSRTTYVATLAVILAVYVIHYQKSGLFSIKNILTLVLLFAFGIYILYLSPLGDTFLKSDSEMQLDSRLIHWTLGYEIWSKSKLLGVGINSHVYYMTHEFSSLTYGDFAALAFFTSNPIHNVHMIALAEAGIVGFALWLYFFITRIHYYSKNSYNQEPVNNILNLTYVGVLIAFVLYGFFGWSPFNKEIYGTVIFFGYFAQVIPSRRLARKPKIGIYEKISN